MDSATRAVGVQSRGCSKDGGGDVVTQTVGGRQCDESDGRAANDATRAGGDNNGNQLDWAANFATKAGSR